MKFRAAFLSLILLFAWDAKSKSDEPVCPGLFRETVFGREVDVRQVGSEAKARVLKNERHISLEDLFGSEEAVFLGIIPNGHFYLQVGKMRFDGDFFPSFGAIKTSVRTASDGTLLAFRGISQEAVERLKSYLVSNAKKPIISSSCVHGACKVLKQGAGIRFSGREPLLATTIYRRLLTEGLIDSEGRAISIDIIRTNSVSLEEIHTTVRNRQLAFSIGMPALLALVPGYLIVVSIATRPDR